MFCKYIYSYESIYESTLVVRRSNRVSLCLLQLDKTQSKDQALSANLSAGGAAAATGRINWQVVLFDTLMDASGRRVKTASHFYCFGMTSLSLRRIRMKLSAKWWATIKNLSNLCGPSITSGSIGERFIFTKLTFRTKGLIYGGIRPETRH